MRTQYEKQSEFINELEGKLTDAEKRNKEHKHQQQQQQQQQDRSSTPDSSHSSLYDPYSRPRSTRLPRTSTNGSLSSSSNPVKMVQEMVGRVRVKSFIYYLMHDFNLFVIFNRAWKQDYNHVVHW